MHWFYWKFAEGYIIVKYRSGSILVIICKIFVFSFQDDNFSKFLWIFTKLGVCIDIMEIWFRIVNGQISLIFDRVNCLRYIRFSFPNDNLSSYPIKLGVCIDIVETLFGIADGQISSIFDKVICPWHVLVFISGR